MHLEDNLKRALARQSAPDGFAERVAALAAVSAEASPSPAAERPVRGVPSRFTRAIAAGLLLTAVAGGWAAQKAIERREGERAREEVLVALHIASAKVRAAQLHVHEIGSH